MNINRNTNKKKLSDLIITLILLAAIAVFLLFWIQKQKNFHKSLFQVVDCYDTQNYTIEQLDDIYAQDDFLENLKHFNQDLHHNNEFQYVEVGTQALEFIGHWDKPASLANGYGHKDLRNQKAEQDGKEVEITPVNSFQIARQSQKPFFGRDLFPDQAFVQNGNTVSLILGNGFQNYYKIGDQISFIYLYQTWIGTVTGFLDQQEKIELDDFYIFDLDTFIIMPYFEQLLPDKVLFDNERFQISYYIQKNYGYLKLKDKKEFRKGKKYIEQLASKYHLDYTLLKGY